MKKNNNVAILLVSLLVNIGLSFLLGYKYKTPLVTFLSEPIYYQVVIFISLLAPIIIKSLFEKYNSLQRKWKRKKFLGNIRNIKMEQLDEQTKEMVNDIVNTDIDAITQIREIHQEMRDELQK